VSVFSTAGSAGFEATPGPRLTTPGDADALAEADVVGLVLSEALALADAVALAESEDLAVTVGEGGCAATCWFDRETSAYAPPPAASITSTTTMMNAAFLPPEDGWPPGGRAGCAP
jgi:hypothetical protein